MKKITLVRHGETFQNRHGIVQGWDPTWGRLTEKGIRQAALLGESMAQTPMEICFCSPLERSMLTLAQMLIPRPGDRTVPLVFHDDLREINQGVLHGQPHAVWKEAMVGLDPISFRPEQGESWLDVQARVSRYFMTSILAVPHNHVVIVAHGGVNRGILATLTGLSMAQAWPAAIKAISAASIQMSPVFEGNM